MSADDDVFREGRRRLVHSSLIYLLADARKLADTGYAPFGFHELSVSSDVARHSDDRDARAIRNETIFSSILKILRAEAYGTESGLASAGGGSPSSSSSSSSLHKDREDNEGLMQALDQYIKESLADPGGEVELCSTTGKPWSYQIESHQHAGSSETCLCTKFGMHYAQVLVDHIVRSEEEKRAKEAIESKGRVVPNAIVRNYRHFMCDPPMTDPTEREREEDGEIDRVIGDAMEQLRKQLREGSFLEVILRDDSKTMWMNDRHPDRECVYAISVNDTEKTLTVAFRGTVCLENWISNFKANLVNRANPIQKDYDGKTEFLSLHEGFSAYLLRRRQDSGETKYDEIAEAALRVGGTEGRYRLIVTGHSLGGALAAIFGFYASADDRFRRADGAPPVDVFSAGAPKAGDESFLRAFRHQESCGKLRHVRFFNWWDVVPDVPPDGRRRGRYVHVGVGVMLRAGATRPPKIKYNSGGGVDAPSWTTRAMWYLRDSFLWTLIKAFVFFKIEYHLVHRVVRNIGHSIDYYDDAKGKKAMSIGDLYDVRTSRLLGRKAKADKKNV